MAREVTRPVVPPADAAKAETPDAVQHAGLRFVPDGSTLWAVHPDRPEDGQLVYAGGQRLPEWVLENLAADAVLVPGPAGVLVLEQPRSAKR
jgi:hypothetical protein